MAIRRNRAKTRSTPSESTDPEESGGVTLLEPHAAGENDAQTTLIADEPMNEPVAEVVSADPASGLEDAAELKAAIEALLFASPDPLSPKKLSRALGDLDTKVVREAAKELADAYEHEHRGIQIVEVAGGFQMCTRERFAEYILRLGAKKRSNALSNATLETLAIVAYRQPIIRAQVESIRGVESSGMIRNLLDLELIEVVGKKEVIGRPSMYGTTKKFLKLFGLRNLRDMPSIQGLRERFAEKASAEPEEKEIAEDENREDAPELFDEDDTPDDENEASSPDEEVSDVDGDESEPVLVAETPCD